MYSYVFKGARSGMPGAGGVKGLQSEVSLHNSKGTLNDSGVAGAFHENVNTGFLHRDTNSGLSTSLSSDKASLIAGEATKHSKILEGLGFKHLGTITGATSLTDHFEHPKGGSATVAVHDKTGKGGGHMVLTGISRSPSSYETAKQYAKKSDFHDI